MTIESRGRQRERVRILGNWNKYIKGIYKSILGKIECWKCGKRGLLKKDCRAPKNKGDRRHETTQEANVVGDVLQDEVWFLH